MVRYAPMSTTRIRTRIVTFWLTPAEYEALSTASKEAGLSVSEAMRLSVKLMLEGPASNGSEPQEAS